MQPKKIFISAFSCLPVLGSEPGVAWHWVLEMSKYFELWVLVHKEKVIDIETYVVERGLDKKIHFIYFDIPCNSLFFNKKRDFRWVRIYYFFWTLLSKRIARRTMQENGIEIFHHLTFGNALWRVNGYGQQKFFIWGPIGGLDAISPDFSRHFSAKSRLIEWLRRSLIASLAINRGFYSRCRNADLILCKTESTINKIPLKFRDKAKLFTDVALEEFASLDTKEKKIENPELSLISVGRLDGWRGMDVLIESFCQALKTFPNMKLQILGDGIEREKLGRLIALKNLSGKVNLLGNVQKSKYDEIISRCDIVINACLKEGAVTVSFDSMRYGKPLICVDSVGGFTRYFSDEYAIVLSKQSRTALIEDMTEAILKLTDSSLRSEMGAKAQKAAEEFTWEAKGLMIRDIIEEALTKENKINE